MLIREIGFNEVWVKDIKRELTEVEVLGVERLFIETINTIGYLHGVTYKDLTFTSNGIFELEGIPKFYGAFLKKEGKGWNELEDADVIIKEVALTECGKMIVHAIIPSDTTDGLDTHWDWYELLK